MLSFTAWSGEVVFRQGVESNALMPLSMVTVCPQEKAGYMVRSVRFIIITLVHKKKKMNKAIVREFEHFGSTTDLAFLEGWEA